MIFTHSMKHAAVLLSCLLYLSACSSSSIQNTSQSSPTDSANNSSSPPSKNETETKNIDSFSDGVNKATSASKLAQSAQSADGWSQVATEWQTAVSLMQSVPSSSSNYSVAQQRVGTYQKNLSYAQQNVTRLKQKQAKIREAQIVRGEMVFKSLKGIYQTAGEASATPVVRVIIPKEGWNKLSKPDRNSLTMYAENLIPVIKSNPEKYVSTPSSAPIYDTFVRKIANLCQDCWSIILSNSDSQPYGIDETVAQGDTPWLNDDPCCRGAKSSEFRK